MTFTRAGWAAGLLTAAVMITTVGVPAVGAASAHTRATLPRAAPYDPPEPFAPATGPLGPDGAPAPVAEPGPAPSPEELRRWDATAAELVRSAAELTALRADTEVRHQETLAARAEAEAGRVRQDTLGELAGVVAAAEYRGSGLDGLLGLLDSAPDQLLARWRTRQEFAGALVHRLREAEQVARERAGRADAVQATEEEAVRRAQDSERAGQLLAAARSLQLAELAARFGDGSWPNEAAPRPEEAAPRPEEAAPRPADERPGPAAEAAVAYALAHLGSPYVWGATGPDRFDCSGLTSQAWQAARVTVPRTSQEQWAGLPRLAPAAPLRPGDLVVWFEDATHIGIYAGDGLVVHAPRPGSVVRLTALHRMPVLGVVRPAAEES